MNRPAAITASLPGENHRGQEAFSWIAGLGFTLALFLGLANFENLGADHPSAEIPELRLVSMPFETPPPPPRPAEPVPSTENMPAFAGLDVAATDSAVRIAVLPPDLEALLPSTREPPRAVIQPGYLQAGFKPRMDVEAAGRRIYQVSEVDQPPQAIVRVAPSVPKELYGDARTLRVVLLLLIEADGRVASARVVQSSGQPVFDQATVETVKTLWEFTPAIRRGQQVKCLAQQNVRVNLGSTSPFETR